MYEQKAIPLVDLRAQYESIRAEVLPAIGSVLAGMHLFLGDNVVAFEHEFADYCGARFCVGVGSGTDALMLALRAAGVGHGHEVITVANTFIATVEAIAMVGATPVFVDVDPTTYNLDARQIEARITPRTRAIVPVHLYGRLANMASIGRIARRHGLIVIEDACQAHGAMSEGRRAGTFGTAGCFSFYFSKNLGAYGEAGAIVTDEPEIARQAAILRDHGSPSKYQHVVLGVNSRLDELQAAILRVKLRHLDRWNEQRRSHARTYGRLLAGLDLKLPDGSDQPDHVNHLYVIRARQRDRLREALDRAGVATGIHYPVPIHRQPAWTDRADAKVDLPVTEALAGEILTLPMFPELSDGQIEYVCQSLARAMAVSPADSGASGFDLAHSGGAVDPLSKKSATRRARSGAAS